MPPATESKQELTIPEGWVPVGAKVHVGVIQDDDGHWEAILPEFALASMGDTAQEAIDSVGSMLREYLALCARDGMTFEQSYRKFGWPSLVASVRMGLRAWLRWRRSRPYRHDHRPLQPLLGG